MYAPAEDSYSLSENLKKYLKDKDKNTIILDLGTGSGIQAETCRKLGFNNILAADVDKSVIGLLKKKGFKAIKSNLFSNIKNKFDLIVFNPPYLPSNRYDKEKDTTGGKQGYETIIRFLKQAKNYLNENGKVLLIYSSLSKPKIINKKAKELGYKMKLLSKKKLFFEELFIIELRR